MSSPEPIVALVSNTCPIVPHLGDLLSYCSFPVIGLGLVERLLSKHASSDIAIFATARDPAKANALVALQKKHPSKLFIVPYDAEDRQSAKAVAKQVEERFGWVDVVVGNAG
jgi:NAD(P)-dependent dehydrogenase (short-subunit alcohol dehydrogenase family)